MFGFMDMEFNYEDRKVDNYNDGNVTVDTTRVSDGEHPFETRVSHKDFNDGKWIIVEAYDSRDKAQAGHNKWVKKMTTDIPDTLIDCQNSEISNLIDSSEMIFKRVINA